MTEGAVGLGLWLKRLCSRSNLSQSDVELIAALPGQPYSIAANVDFVRAGETVESVCLLSDGVAASFGEARAGRRLTALHLPGDAVDLQSTVLPNACCALTALTDVSLFRVPRKALADAAERSPSLAQALWRDSAVNVSIANEWLVNAGRRDARTRLAHLICELSMRHALAGGNRDDLGIGLKQAHLADASGISPVHVNRMLAELRDAELLTPVHGGVRIDDWEALAQLGEFNSSYLHLPEDVSRSLG